MHRKAPQLETFEGRSMDGRGTFCMESPGYMLCTVMFLIQCQNPFYVISSALFLATVPLQSTSSARNCYLAELSYEAKWVLFLVT